MELIFIRIIKEKIMEHISLFEYKPTPSVYKTRRAELISRLVEGINLKRIGTKYKQVTLKQIAIRCNMNPFLKSDDELELLIKTCEEKGSYSKFFFVCPLVESKI